MADKKPDTKALSWVSGEIRQSLDSARAALETLVEDDSATGELNVILEQLQLVKGTLKMIGLFGGILLTDELISLVKALQAGKVASIDDAHEALMRGIIQLPAYIDNLQHGQRDIPIILLPLLNDIRALCGGQLLTESAFFAPDLGVFPDTVNAPATDIREVARKLRPAYQLSLVNLLRDVSPRESLRRAGTVLHQIERSVATREEQQLWWVACGLIESLYDQGLELNASIKHILSILDRRLKDLVANGEAGPADNHEVLKNTLFYIAQARSKGKRVSLLKQKFNLDDILPDQAETEKARNDLLGLDSSLLSNVAQAISEDMLQIKEAMDVYSRSTDRNIDRLSPVVDRIKTVADTLGMIGMGEQRSELISYYDVLHNALATGGAADDELMMNLASALLVIESALGHEDAEDSGIVVGQGDMRDLILAAGTEAKKVLATVKDIISGLVDGHATREHIAALPGHLRSVSGALHMVGRSDGAARFDSLRNWLEAAITDISNPPSDADLSWVADIITGGEYFIDAIVDDPTGAENALRVMSEGLEQLSSVATASPTETEVDAVDEFSAPDEMALLDETGFDQTIDESGFSFDTVDEDSAPPEVEFDAEALTGHQDSVEEAAFSLDLGSDESFDLETVEPFDDSFPAAAEQEFLTGDFSSDETFASAAELDEPEAVAEQPEPIDEPEPVAIEETVITAPDDVDEDIDDEVMEIFLEEVQEESDSIREMLASWISDAGDDESLGTLRRSFHTIKGSGRIVGATELGEFAWAIENMLNRLIDNTISRTPELLQVLEMARDALPGFIAELKGEGKVTADVDLISSAAHTLSEGQVPDLAAAGGGSAPEAPESEDSSQGMDPVLAEIFGNETRNHINTVRNWLADHGGEISDHKADPGLVRALHTLHGSSHMAGVMQMVAITDSLEKYIKLRANSETRVSGEFLSVLSDTMDAIEALLTSLPGETPELPGQASLESRAAQLLEEDGLYDAPQLDANGGPISEDLAIDVGGDEFALTDDNFPVFDLPEPDMGQIEEAELGGLPAMPVPDEVDPELLGIFVEEAEEILHDMDSAIDAWRLEAGSLPALQAMQRLLHTLKGGARMAGVSEIGDLAHDVESVIMAATDDGAQLDQMRFSDMIQSVHDWMSMAVERLRDNGFLSRPPHLSSDNLHALLDAEQAAPDMGSLPAAFDVDEPVSEAGSVWEDQMSPADAPGHADFNIAGDSSSEVFDLELADAVPTEPPTPSAAPGAGEDRAGYDEELLEVFLEEAAEILHNTDDLLQRWVGDVENSDTMKELQRALHTLKGGARMAGIKSIGDLSHSIETAMEALDEGRCRNHQALLGLVQQSYDWLAGAVENIRDGGSVQYPANLVRSIDAAAGSSAIDPAPAADSAPVIPHTDLTADGQEFADMTPASENENVDPVLASIIRSTDRAEPKTPEEAQKKQAETADTAAAPKSGAEVVRISSDLLENLINNAGEMSIYRSRIDQQLSTMTNNLVELDGTVGRIREQLRKFEIEAEAQILYRFEGSGDQGETRADFDPLELDRFSNMQQLSRSLAEAVGDLSSIQKFISGLTRETEILLVQQSRVNSELQNGLMRTRLLPFTSILPRLRRIVRQVAQELGKQVEFSVHGAEAEMDRTVLNRLVPALEHMLRNAIDHGLETPDRRKKTGKAETGNISLSFTRVGSEIVLRIEDDGAGMNLDAIRKKAIERGLMNASAALSDNEVVQFVLEAGFSTASKVTQISGRGVGMDVVTTEIKQLGGSLYINTQPGKGTRFTVHLPLTVSVNQALMVLVGEETYAIPLSSIVGITRLEKYELDRLISGSETHYQYADDHFQFFHMGSTMGICRPRTIGEKERIPLILAHAGEHSVALLTEAILGRSEVVVKTVGPQISSVKGISGATIMGDGSVALILDVPNLIRASIAQIATVMPGEQLPVVEQDAGDKETIILVVDDSITVRKVTERLLKRHNLVPITAKDGLDALDKLQEFTPDLILSDIEMPRMDGYEFITNVKKDARLASVPVIMITSRTGDKHRERAMGLGVNLYMGKPFQESELLENINNLLGSQVESE